MILAVYSKDANDAEKEIVIFEDQKVSTKDTGR